VAYLETRYKGPFDFNYNPQQTSTAGAKGPMQIIPRYAKAFGGKRATAKRLLQDIDLNVMVSMKMLAKWHSIYHDWSKACGAYNTGQPIINSYAKKAINPKYYLSKWM
jgi:soluble lytic murein transglycosylase-like protein